LRVVTGRSTWRGSGVVHFGIIAMVLGYCLECGVWALRRIQSVSPQSGILLARTGQPLVLEPR
jgi:hypothetical protein